MKRMLLSMTIICGLATPPAAPAQAAGFLRTQTTRTQPVKRAKFANRAKMAMAFVLSGALIAAPAAGLASPPTFAREAAKQLHPAAATVGRQIAYQLDVLSRESGWQVNYHAGNGMHAIAAQAPAERAAVQSPAGQRALSELQRFAGVPAQKGLTQFAVHFTEKGVLSINASNQQLAAGAPVDTQVHWRYMAPKARGVVSDLLGKTDAGQAPQITSAWYARATPWGIFVRPAPPAADLTSLMP